jgi:HEAT repeat protein
MNTLRKVLSRKKAIVAGCKEVQAVKHDPDALAALLDRTRTDDAPVDVQTMAVLATHRHKGDEKIMQALERTLRTSNHPNVRSVVAAALGEIGGPRAVDLLHVAQKDPSKQVRDNAEYSLHGLETGELPITARQ